MTNRIVDLSMRKVAIVAGCELLIMTLFTVFADFFVFKSLQ